ncbi:hypothetical protein ACOSP7_017014 [Xanthoceras sorbifolium]
MSTGRLRYFLLLRRLKKYLIKSTQTRERLINYCCLPFWYPSYISFFFLPPAAPRPLCPTRSPLRPAHSATATPARSPPGPISLAHTTQLAQQRSSTIDPPTRDA